MKQYEKDEEIAQKTKKLLTLINMPEDCAFMLYCISNEFYVSAQDPYAGKI